ncbi:MAG: hypothetical protein IIB11_07960, partial [Chloroflexi bacterium]|nr:hypothetical protein [Chloroflexota bacterium]
MTKPHPQPQHPRTPVPGVEQSVAQTASYRIEIDIGPALTMLSAEEGITTMMQMALMSQVDQGQPVN